ncbi:hypothetical protein DMA11_07440 [Marinilabiliaceae bacterium JC017]|nr:hypothetical protein DMA11_07440 [Marinilabiliaceae bacterium JC017]
MLLPNRISCQESLALKGHPIKAQGKRRAALGRVTAQSGASSRLLAAHRSLRRNNPKFRKFILTQTYFRKAA